jgi:hypothetical protein
MWSIDLAFYSIMKMGYQSTAPNQRLQLTTKASGAILKKTNFIFVYNESLAQVGGSRSAIVGRRLRTGAKNG